MKTLVTGLPLDEYKKNLLLELLQDEINRITSGDTSYGSDADNADAVEALVEMRDALPEIRTL